MAPRTVLDRLTSAPWEFDFFAAVRAFLADRTRKPVGTDALPDAEAVRFRGHPSLAFPPRRSAVGTGSVGPSQGSSPCT